MNEAAFWDRVKRGCEKADIPASTFYVWRNRGAVSKQKAFQLFEALKGTEHEIPLEELLKKRRLN